MEHFAEDATSVSDLFGSEIDRKTSYIQTIYITLRKKYFKIEEDIHAAHVLPKKSRPSFC